MIPILKFLLFATTIAACLYGIDVFGVSMWPVIFLMFSFIILLSLFVPKLNMVSIVIAKTIGIVSLLAFALLMLAATVGGSFRMSEGNQVIAIALALMAVFGCLFFLVKSNSERNT